MWKQAYQGPLSKFERPDHCSSRRCSSAYSLESPESEAIVGKKRSGRSGLHQGHQVIGPLKEMRASQVPRPFQSTREYVSGKVQAGTQQILLLVGPFMLSAQKRLVAEYEEPEVDLAIGADRGPLIS
jgi:hypothetical protein